MYVGRDACFHSRILSKVGELYLARLKKFFIRRKVFEYSALNLKNLISFKFYKDLMSKIMFYIKNRKRIGQSSLFSCSFMFLRFNLALNLVRNLFSCCLSVVFAAGQQGLSLSLRKPLFTKSNLNTLNMKMIFRKPYTGDKNTYICDS